MKCYNYINNYCTNYKYMANVNLDSTYCNTACNNDATCRASFTYRPQHYIDEGKNQKMCYHCSKQYDDQGIPIEPIMKNTPLINDLNICYDISFNDLSDSEKQNCDWNNLSQTKKSTALNNCKWNNLQQFKKTTSLNNNCNWHYLSPDKKTEAFLNNCEWNNLSPARKAATLNNCEWNNLSDDKKTAIRSSILSTIKE